MYGVVAGMDAFDVVNVGYCRQVDYWVQVANCAQSTKDTCFSSVFLFLIMSCDPLKFSVRFGDSVNRLCFQLYF